jgi:hypothetical protein
LSTHETGKEKPVRLQRTTNLHERTGQVVHMLQRQCRDNEVETLGREGKHFLVDNESLRRARRQGGSDRRGLYYGFVAAICEHVGDERRGCPEIKRVAEGAEHGGEPVAHVLDDARQKKIGRLAGKGPREPAAQQCAVKNLRRCGS